MSKYFTVKEVISGLPEEKVPHRLLIDTINEKLVYDLDEDTRIDLSNASELLKKQDKFAEITTDADSGAIKTIFLGKTDLTSCKYDYDIEVITASHSFDTGIARISVEEDSQYYDGNNIYAINLYDDYGQFNGGCIFRCENTEILNLITDDVEFELSEYADSFGQMTLSIFAKAQNCVQVENVADPINDKDAANKKYVDNRIPAGLSLIDISGYYAGTEEPVRVDVNFTKPAKVNIPTLDVNIENEITFIAPNLEINPNERRVGLYADYIDLGNSHPEIDLKSGVVQGVTAILGEEDIGLSINYLKEPELSHQAATKNYVDKSLPIISADEPIPEEGRIWLQPANVSTGAVDYIVERGIIGNWHYTKWASGECEAYGAVTVQATSSTQSGSTYYSNIVSASMPFAITDATVTGSFGTAHWISNCYTSGSNVCFRLNHGASIAINADISGNIVVKGLWK